MSIPTSTATFGTGSGPFQSSFFKCGPDTTNFQSCLRATERLSTCKPNLGVFCGCTENSLRIVPLRSNGNSPTEGRLEICRNNRWGTVCSQGWDDSDAAVACRQLDIQSGKVISGTFCCCVVFITIVHYAVWYIMYFYVFFLSSIQNTLLQC